MVASPAMAQGTIKLGLHMDWLRCPHSSHIAGEVEVDDLAGSLGLSYVRGASLEETFGEGSLIRIQWTTKEQLFF
jgi:hypothetical protein